VDMDAFFASVEQLTRPTLRTRPVLVGGLGPRGVVAGASYQARAFGARSAMPMAQARRLVPASAVILPPRGKLYQMVSARVFGVISEAAPVLEQVSLDEAFAEPPDLSGADEAAVRDFGAALRGRVLAETGLVASLGAGSGKQVAKIASGAAKPDGLVVVPQGGEREYLAGMPVRALWGIGPVAEAKLRAIGVLTIGELAALSERDVTAMLGSVGADLRLLATGVDERPVAERGEAKQVSAETTFDTDITDLPRLRAEVRTVAKGAHDRLVRSGRGARTVSIKLRHADMSIVSRSETTRDPSTDLDQLTAVAERLLPDPREFGPVRLAGVAFSGLADITQQPLFDLGGPEPEPGEPAAPQGSPGPAEVRAGWRPGDDVVHDELGPGWVQGAGNGRVTVRFETRGTGPGPARTLAHDDPALHRGDPELSLS
jgi:DNA polymerase-4